VFLNLFQNAAQAFDKKGGEIKVLAAQDHDNTISITVEDDGPGIKEEDVAKIFVPYFSKKPDGTGLGLAIVKKIVEEHGGNISFESVPGSYTRFHIHLPYVA
jgi:two-component system nitrogen regulation sensor histidine kinase NtrY